MGKSGRYRDMLTAAWLLFSAWKVGAGRGCHSFLNNLGKAATVISDSCDFCEKKKSWWITVGINESTFRMFRISWVETPRHQVSVWERDHVCFHQAQWLWDTPPPSLISHCFLCLCFLFIMLSFAEAKRDGVRLTCAFLRIFAGIVWLRLCYSPLCLNFHHAAMKVI